MRKHWSQIIRDERLDRKFRQDGYVLTPEILSDEIIKQLRALFNQHQESLLNTKTDNVIIAMQDARDAARYQLVDQEVRKILHPVVESQFMNYQILMGTFLIKRAGDATYMNPHQDWNLTDESQFYSLNFWIPLEDMTDTNGCLSFLPGSHLIIPTVRPNYNYTWAYKQVEDFIKKRMVKVYPRKRQAVLLNHAVIHASDANISGKPRVVCVLTLIPKEAPILHYFCQDRQHVSVYELSSADFYELDYNKRPQKAAISEVNYNFPRVGKCKMYYWYYISRKLKR